MQDSKLVLIGIIAVLAVVIAAYALWQGQLLSQKVASLEERVAQIQLTPKASATIIVPDDLKPYATVQGNTVSIALNITGNALSSPWAKYLTGQKPILTLNITGPPNAFPLWLEVYANVETSTGVVLYQGWQVGLTDPVTGAVAWGKAVSVGVDSPTAVSLYLRDFYVYGNGGSVTIQINIAGRW